MHGHVRAVRPRQGDASPPYRTWLVAGLRLIGPDSAPVVSSVLISLRWALTPAGVATGGEA